MHKTRDREPSEQHREGFINPIYDYHRNLIPGE
jgi:hypothetical protein